MALPERVLPGHVVRRLWPGDGQAVSDYFLRLDSETRASRFLGAAGEAGVRAYAARAVTAEGLIFGAFVEGVLRGVGELRPLGPRPAFSLGTRAEAAFAVERDYRRRGIGATLFARIVRAARNRGVGDLQVRCLARNQPMLRLAAKLGADITPQGGEARAALHLDGATPLSLWYETIAEACDFTLSVVHPALPLDETAA